MKLTDVSDSDQENSIYKKLEELTAALEKIQKNAQGSNHYFINSHVGEEEKLALLSSDIKDKEDLLFLVRHLPSVKDSNTLKKLIQVNLITSLLRHYPIAKAGLTDEELFELFQNWINCKESYTFRWSISKLFNFVLKRIDEEGLNQTLKKVLLLFRTPDSDYPDAERLKINERIDYTLQDKNSVNVSQHDNWGPIIIDFINSIQKEEIKKGWVNLINHCLMAGDKSTPTKKWLDEVQLLLKEIENSQFSIKICEWLDFNKQIILAIHKNERRDFLRDVNHNLLKNLLWCCGFINDSSLNAALDSYASIAYRKKPGTGPISAKTGTACMYAFSLLPFKEGITRLMKFKNKIVNNTILKSIDRIISEVAAKNGYSNDLVEEIGVMDFGLDQNGEKSITFDKIVCTITVKNVNNLTVQWYNDGVPQKSIPGTVKTAYPAKLKELKNDIKELESQLQVQKVRIENYYLKKKKWNFNEWIKNYLHHPLVKIVADKLIWHFKKDDLEDNGFFDKHSYRNAKGQIINWLDDSTEVELWHPLYSTLEEVVGWRNFIQEQQITQPFKQAYREIYLITDAEIRTQSYSNRFAAHILRQHQFAALCKLRGWQYHLMGNWDSHNTPSTIIPEWGMMIQYYIDADWNGITNEAGIFNYISTDQVRFHKDGQLLELLEVPKLVFSEIMRDVDLFVGVASIGNDPNWMDAGNNRFNDYWRQYSFGDLTESAKIRRDVLQKLIPRLKIASKCSFDSKFLIVKGQLRTYKIHMGSGNILMEPNDQYLCIVPGGRSEKDNQKIYLPFEGDTMLSIIISKALLLADDIKITDESITRQIKNEF